MPTKKTSAALIFCTILPAPTGERDGAAGREGRGCSGQGVRLACTPLNLCLENSSAAPDFFVHFSPLSQVDKMGLQAGKAVGAVAKACVLLARLVLVCLETPWRPLISCTLLPPLPGERDGTASRQGGGRSGKGVRRRRGRQASAGTGRSQGRQQAA